MLCGFWRSPPRRPVFAGRVTVLLCVFVVLFAGSAAPARAYVCAPSSSHPPRGAGQKDCDRQQQPVWRKHGDADAMSFVFFIGVVIAIVLVPVTFGRREKTSPE
ncbi:MAG: hypothetical protein E6G31_10190 [Actinobacteria bacterium]|nr:MAG: hypothetical protein E6G31_10190 [Actinomycetota bacterium]